MHALLPTHAVRHRGRLLCILLTGFCTVHVPTRISILEVHRLLSIVYTLHLTSIERALAPKDIPIPTPSLSHSLIHIQSIFQLNHFLHPSVATLPPRPETYLQKLVLFP